MKVISIIFKIALVCYSLALAIGLTVVLTNIKKMPPLVHLGAESNLSKMQAIQHINSASSLLSDSHRMWEEFTYSYYVLIFIIIINVVLFAIKSRRDNDSQPQ